MLLTCKSSITHYRVVLADRGLVQVVVEGIADAGMDALAPGFRLLPVVAEFRFAAHGPLIGVKALFLLFGAIAGL